MKEKMKFLQELYQKSPQGFLILDSKGSVIWSNTAVVEFLDRQVIGINVLTLLRQNNSEEIVWPPNSNTITRRYIQGELMEIVVSPIPNSPTLYLISVNRLEGENGIKTEIEGKMHKMIAQVQHDLKAPLNGIIGFATLAIEDLTDLSGQHLFQKQQNIVQKLQQYLTYVLEGSRSMNNKINRFLLIERLEQGIGQAQKKEFDIIAFTKSVTEKFYLDKAITIHQNVVSSDHIIKADPDLLEIALENMLKNAKEAIEEDDNLPRSIVFNFGILHDVGVFQISNPSSISTENLHKLFNTQFTTKENGTGLGTKSIRLVAKAHSGEVSAKRQGDMLTVTLKIPQKN